MHRARTAIATAVFATVSVTSADELIEVKDGDVISAEVINSLIQAANNGAPPIPADAFIGEWGITQYVPFNGQPGNGSCRPSCTLEATVTDSADGLSRFRQDAVVFTQNGTEIDFVQDTYDSFVLSFTNSPASGTMGVIGDTVIFNSSGSFSYYYGKKLSDTEILLQSINSGSNSFNTVLLEKRNIPPTPVNNLAATSVSSVIQLTWTDQSDNEDGFRVERRPPVSNASWSTLQSLGANVVSFTDSTAATSETWQYRIFAFNSLGDSKTSSVIQHTLITSGG